jgi:hypothetical protein
MEEPNINPRQISSNTNNYHAESREKGKMKTGKIKKRK